MRWMMVQQFKNKIAKEILLKYPGYDGVHVNEIYFRGKLLKGDSTLLSHHGIRHMSTVEASAGLVQFQCRKDPVMPSHSSDDKQEDKKRLSLECLADFVEPCGSSGEQDSGK
ncbi:hypothetical protein ILYODFUR_034211 [Ilyodon furcidens]|uniref:Ubiquitin-like domain-containing protein n=1 Tax=Ilyodon furcidens TaxID=33524 RepID=A0ABV0U3W8_9TELE